MDKSDKILAAIEQLAANLTGQLAAVRTEVRTVDAKVDAVVAIQTEHGQRLERLEAGQAKILDHLDVAELRGRVDEQGRTIAQLIPARIAAIPGR